MTHTTYRVLTHGRFGPLTGEQRAALIARAGEHGLLAARFTGEGTVTYDPSLLSFTFRCVVDAEGEPGALGAAEERATAAVAALGGTCAGLRSTATDMSAVKINRKGRAS